ncbi:MAG: DUF1330 domain-containing protein [Bacteroidota bacterium]
MNQPTHIHTTPESGRNFFAAHRGKGKVVMLNLLKFKEKADYSISPELAPANEISGEAAYQTYAKHALPLLEKAGSKTLFYGTCSPFLIGPSTEAWDAMLLVEHESAEAFVAFSQDKAYLKIVGHRTAALEDSRLLPIKKGSLL